MAESLGINVDRLFTITFAFGSGMAGIGGGLGAERFRDQAVRAGRFAITRELESGTRDPKQRV